MQKRGIGIAIPTAIAYAVRLVSIKMQIDALDCSDDETTGSGAEKRLNFSRCFVKSWLQRISTPSI
jgi:hypothetical protein